MGNVVDAPPAGVEELRQWALDPRSRVAFSAISSRRFLLVQLTAAAAEPQVAAWLRQLPCPVIGVGAEDAPLAPACDVVVDSEAAAAPLTAHIERCPLAASVLCQLLRASEELPIADALVAESLAYSTLQSGPEFRRWLAQYTPPSAPPRDAGPPVIVERSGAALSIVLNRPSNRNAMSVEVRDALIEALELVIGDDSITLATISGAGRCFSVGGDLAEFGSVPDPATGHVVRSLALPARLLELCADRVSFRLHGACIGAGIELPSFSMRTRASADAFFQLPELRFGLIPGAGGCIGIARRVGRQRTAWLALSGKRISAARALEWGLVDAVDPVGAEPRG